MNTNQSREGLLVSYEHEIPMGHRLMNHEGKCRFLHGHNYRVKTALFGLVQEATGMVVDFHQLKTAVRKVLEDFDHAFVLQDSDKVLYGVEDQKIIYTAWPPTAENLALMWRELLAKELQVQPGRLQLMVNETRDCAVYTP